MEETIEPIIRFMRESISQLERVLNEYKPDTNNLNETLEYDRRYTQLKQIKDLLKQLENGTK